MKHLSILPLLLCINTHLQSMEIDGEKIPLLSQVSLIKNDGLTEEARGSIHEQLHSHTSIEYEKRIIGYEKHIDAEPSLMDQIILENNQTLCSPTHNDLCHPKKLVVKTVLTLCLAGLYDGCLSGTVAAIIACGGWSPPAIVYSALGQSIIAPMACGVCWGRNCLALTMALDHDNYNPNYRAYVI